ncbi:MAG: hypothetical protein Q9160_000590 [Pyrenula sp. 1 TL-2023]
MKAQVSLQASMVYQFQVMAILQLFAGIPMPGPPPIPAADMLDTVEEGEWLGELIVIEGVDDMDIDISITLSQSGNDWGEERQHAKSQSEVKYKTRLAREGSDDASTDTSISDSSQAILSTFFSYSKKVLNAPTITSTTVTPLLSEHNEQIILHLSERNGASPRIARECLLRVQKLRLLRARRPCTQ